MTFNTQCTYHVINTGIACIVSEIVSRNVDARSGYYDEYSNGEPKGRLSIT